MMETTPNPDAVVLPAAEEVYDLELEELQHLQTKIDEQLKTKTFNPRYDSFEKFERKAAKLRSLIDLEVSERQQVDDLITFFVNGPEPDVGEEREKEKEKEKEASNSTPTKESANPFLKKSEIETNAAATSAEGGEGTESEFGQSDGISAASSTTLSHKSSVSGAKSVTSGLGRPPAQRGYLAKKMGKQSKSAKKALFEFMKEKLNATRQDNSAGMVVGKSSIQNPTPPAASSGTVPRSRRSSSRGNNAKHEGGERPVAGKVSSGKGKPKAQSASMSKAGKKERAGSKEKPEARLHPAVGKKASEPGPKRGIKGKAEELVEEVEDEVPTEAAKQDAAAIKAIETKEGNEDAAASPGDKNDGKGEGKAEVTVSKPPEQLQKSEERKAPAASTSSTEEHVHDLRLPNKSATTQEASEPHRETAPMSKATATAKTPDQTPSPAEPPATETHRNPATKASDMTPQTASVVSAGPASVPAKKIATDTCASEIDARKSSESVTQQEGHCAVVNPSATKSSEGTALGENREIAKKSSIAIAAAAARETAAGEKRGGESASLSHPAGQEVDTAVGVEDTIREKENGNAAAADTKEQTIAGPATVKTSEAKTAASQPCAGSEHFTSSGIEIVASSSIGTRKAAAPVAEEPGQAVVRSGDSEADKEMRMAEKGKSHKKPVVAHTGMKEEDEEVEVEEPKTEENTRITEAENKIHRLQREARELAQASSSGNYSSSQPRPAKKPAAAAVVEVGKRPPSGAAKRAPTTTKKLVAAANDKIAEEKREDDEEEKKAAAKPRPKPRRPRQPANTIPAHIEEAIIDYSKYYKSFADIFNGYITEPKKFDLYYTIQDSYNVYKMYNSLLDDKTIFQFTFDVAPMEKTALDYFSYVKNDEMLATKEVSDRMLLTKNQNVESIKKAMMQAKLQERFKRLKEKQFITEEETEESRKIEKEVTQLIDVERRSTLLYRVVKSREEVYDIVTKAFSRKSLWNEMPHGVSLKHTWNLLWTWSKPNVEFNRLLVWQKVNHFIGAKNIARKDYLKRHIERCQNLGQKSAAAFAFIPRTFLLPNEYLELVDTFNKAEMSGEKHNYWIMKPCAKSRGRGISLFNSISAVSYGEPMIVQEYLKNPLLLNGYKFDMRIYVLVTSFNPLEAFIYKEGFARLSTVKFSLSADGLANKFIHLTNSSVQEYSKTKKDTPDSQFSGTKISIEQLKDKLYNQGVDFSGIWQQTIEIVTKTLVACQIDIQYNPSCFELFGYDVIVDSNLKCWLIEVNSSPSLGILNLLDDIVKIRLMDDLVDLLEVLDFDRKRLEEVLHRRLNEAHKVTSLSGTQAAKLLNRDLTYVLNGQEPRQYGEMPKFLGGFERVAPTPFSERIMRLVGGQKMFGKHVSSKPGQAQG